MSPIYRGIVQSLSHGNPMDIGSCVFFFFMSPIYRGIVHSHYPTVTPWIVPRPWSSHLSYILGHCSRSLSKWSRLSKWRETRTLFIVIIQWFSPCHRYTRILFTIIIIPSSSHVTETHGHCSQSVHHGSQSVHHGHRYTRIFSHNYPMSSHVTDIHGYCSQS